MILPYLLLLEVLHHLNSSEVPRATPYGGSCNFHSANFDPLLGIGAFYDQRLGCGGCKRIMRKEKIFLDQQAQEVLEGNDKGGYTIPTAGLYPYQWNWDSAFAAWGFSVFDTKELGKKLKHSSLGNGLTGCSLIYFSAKMIQIIFQDPRCGVRKELDQSPLVV